MRAYYCDEFILPLPPGHRFPMQKYRLLRDRVAREMPGVELHVPPAASDGQLALAHTPDYLDRVCRGLLTAPEQRELGFPWSEAMVERARRSVGATISAARAAHSEGVAVNLAGGTHHAYASKGSGFCVFNDAVVAARLMQAERRARRVVLIDLDVHQGNGSAAIVRDDPSIFTLSLHAAGNFPFRKEEGDLDVALPDGTGDGPYLEALRMALDALDARFDAGFAIFLAGADPHEGDRLGRLKLSLAGLAERDRMVLAWAWRRRVPVAVTMAGGYGHRIEDTCAVHAQTVGLASAHWARWQGTRAASRAAETLG